MNNFPAIAPPQSIREKTISFKQKKMSSAGYTMIANAGALTRKEFTVEWDQITTADKATLEAFFIANYHSPIIWTHFETEIAHTVYFENDELEFEYIAPGWWKTILLLREI